MPKLAANFSMMFGDIDMLDRFEVAARIGFRGAEIQDPYEHTSAEIGRAYRENALEAVLFNMSPGVGAVPGREADFEGGFTRALEYADATGCGQIHCLAGRTDDPRSEATFVSNLQRASAQARPHGVRLLLEPLNTRDNPGSFLTGSTQARRIIDLVGEDNVFLQYDIYHMQLIEGSLAETIKTNLDIISHIQIAGGTRPPRAGRHARGQLPVSVRRPRRQRLRSMGCLRIQTPGRHAGRTGLGSAVRHRPEHLARAEHSLASPR